MTRTSKGCYVALLAMLSVSVATASDCLIISEVVDGPLGGGLPKFVELTNTGTVSIDMSGYWLGNINNGDVSTNAPATQLSGILHPGDSYVCSYEDGDWPGNSTFFDVYGFDADNFDFGSWINGNDVVVLYQADPGTPHDGTGAIDIYGVVGVDGVGEVWEYTDGWAFRLSTVNMNGPFSTGEWAFGGPLSLTDETDLLNLTSPGTHNFSGSCGPTDPVGQCCVNPYYCYIETATGCSSLGGTWTMGADCTGNPCGTPPPTGHCCVGEICHEVTLAECNTMGGTGWAADTYCTPNPCLNCVTIPAAKLLGTGVDVQLCDVVVSNMIDLVASSSFASFNVQEQSQLPGQRGGIAVFGSNADIGAISVVEGDIINIQGTTDEFSGLFELTAPFLYTVVTPYVGDPNDARPEPLQITAADFLSGGIGEEIESMYVEVPCATYVDQGGDPNFAGYTNYTFSDQTGQFTVRVTAGIDVIGQPIPDPNQPVTLRGIFNDFGGYQLLLTRYGDPTDAGGNPNGDLWFDPLCLAVGACCYGPTDEDCVVVSESDCLTTYSGTYQGGGTRCTPFNPCTEPTGICCVAGVCTQEFESTCIALGGGYLGDNTLCVGITAFPCPQPVEPGDVALGHDGENNQYFSATQVRDLAARAAAQVGAWNNHPYVASCEFDNYGGIRHNAQGNLLMLNFGPSGGPGYLFNYCTDGSGRAQIDDDPNEVMFEFVGDRVAAVAVSPDNQWISVWGWLTGQLHILEYDAGPTPGTGQGASILSSYTVTLTHSGGTQGAAWVDNDTLVMANTNTIGRIDLNAVSFDPNDPGAGFTTTTELTLFLAFDTAGAHTDVEYNPEISPYMFVLVSNYDGTSYSSLSVVDPGTWTEITTVDMSTSSETARECALGPDGRLYWTQFGADIDVLDVSDPNSLVANSSVDYYASPYYDSFPGLDIALGPAAPPICRGDCNCDGQIGFGDINPFVDALLSGVYCDGTGENADVNGNGTVGFDDINPFVDLLTSGSVPIPCP